MHLLSLILLSYFLDPSQALNTISFHCSRPVNSAHFSTSVEGFIRSRKSATGLQLYRKFHDYAWNKIVAKEELRIIDNLKYSNSSPAKGALSSNVVAEIRTMSPHKEIPLHAFSTNDKPSVLKLARSALLETQSIEKEVVTTPNTIHVLNFVLLPNPTLRDESYDKDEIRGYLGLPIFGADIVSLPGGKHLVALDFQPASPLLPLFSNRYSRFESKLTLIHAKYQNRSNNFASLLPWGGDIPSKAQRFFSPYALWTRLTDDNAMTTVSSVVFDAFQEYVDLYLELILEVQQDMSSGKVGIGTDEESRNPAWKGQAEYLDYRRANDPARPMLQRLYGEEWAESTIKVLFPKLHSNQC